MTTTAAADWAREHRKLLTLAAVALVAALGFFALRNVLAEVRLKEVRAAFHAIPPARIALALGLTFVSYIALTFYDLLALRTIGRIRPWRTAALASFTSYTLSHNLGLSLLTGGSARYRIYSAAGIDLADVARISLIAAATFWSGVLLVAAVALISSGNRSLDMGGFVLDPALRHGIAFLIFVLFAGMAVARVSGVERLRAGGIRLPLPTLSVMAAQIGVSTIDLLAASAALFILVPQLAPAAFPAFFLAYAVALLAGLVSHVPGGIGVFEAVVLALAPGDRGTVFAALLAYRLIYYLAPLLVAALLIGAVEGHRLRHPIAAGLSLADKAARTMAPPLLALLVFLGGLILLVSGALPAVHGRMLALAEIVPMPFIETSHFAASIAGTALLLIAPALNSRLESGFHAARVLLLGGALFSLLKGIDYEEATVLLTVAGVLQYCRPAFYRRSRLLPSPDLGWLAAAGAAIALSLWAGFFAYKRVPYSDDLWWQFALHGNASRFLRASLGGAVLIGGFGLRALLFRPPPPKAQAALPVAVADQAFAATPRSDAMLAFTGDKSFIVSEAGDAFLMYAVRGGSWVVMGDPVGPRAAWEELVWSLCAACDAAHGRLCFYQASEEMLPLIVELGLQAMKYGEEAHVSLPAFTLDGSAARPLRHAMRRAESAGLSFEIAPAGDMPALLAELRQVSDAWLRDKGGQEKRFSLGRFDEAYLSRFDIALVRHGHRIIAFANIWRSGDGSELSVDLMRHLPDTPYGTMDFLFVSLMQWGAANGYGHFNLGVAPLSGIRGGRLAPRWARLASAVFSNGERLYGFAGLRAFKEKFRPEWVPRYVAVPHGIDGARTLIDLAVMVGI